MVQIDTRIYRTLEIFTESKGLDAKRMKMELEIRAGYACLDYTSNLGMYVRKESRNSLNIGDPNGTHCY
jgi:hypothetical protein